MMRIKLYFFSILILLTVFTISCGGSGGASAGALVAPSGLTYVTTSATYTKNLQISENIPSYTGTVSTWSVTPSLPAGLVLDSSTGIISGTPALEQDAVELTITASNNSGSTTAVVSITVKNIPPAALTYSSTSAVYTKDLPISDNSPTVSTTVSSWSVTPALPAGLSLNETTGVISGTPTVVQSAGYYTITAANIEGSTTAVISITVNNSPPATLTYSTVIAVYTKDLVIAQNVPAVSGTVTSWAVSPDLPDGLTLNTTTGVISGIPVVEQSAANYTITAANIKGSTTAVISIAINNEAPSALSYSKASAVYTVNELISNNKPAVTGTVTSWSVSPNLPQGLTLNTTTGVISGTPRIEQAATNYTITAVNSIGSTTAVISITINNEAPVDLSYSSASAVYTQGIVITINIPAVTGTVTSWSVSPNLPQGLILNTTTGAISGIPESVQVAAKYTISAANLTGTTNTVISIKVNHVAPSALVYSPSVVTLGVGFRPPFFSYRIFSTPINLVPAYIGTVTSWSIDKALPSGVTLNTTTGVISGGGAAPRYSQTYYTITASNSGGSTSTVILINGPQ